MFKNELMQSDVGFINEYLISLLTGFSKIVPQEECALLKQSQDHAALESQGTGCRIVCAAE